MCDFSGQKQPFDLYIGGPKKGQHPLSNQSNWLSKEKSGGVPGDVMEAIQKLYDLSVTNKANFEELCFYALTNASETNNSQIQDGTDKPDSDQGEVTGNESEDSATDEDTDSATDEGTVNASDEDEPVDENYANDDQESAEDVNEDQESTNEINSVNDQESSQIVENNSDIIGAERLQEPLPSTSSSSDSQISSGEVDLGNASKVSESDTAATINDIEAKDIVSVQNEIKQDENEKNTDQGVPPLVKDSENQVHDKELSVDNDIKNSVPASKQKEKQDSLPVEKVGTEDFSGSKKIPAERSISAQQLQSTDIKDEILTKSTLPNGALSNSASNNVNETAKNSAEKIDQKQPPPVVNASQSSSQPEKVALSGSGNVDNVGLDASEKLEPIQVIPKKRKPL